MGAEFKSFLYVYDHKEKLLAEPLLISQHSFWLEPINSGKIINENWVESKIYKQKGEIIVEKSAKKISVHPNFANIYNDLKPSILAVECLTLNRNKFTEVQ